MVTTTVLVGVRVSAFVLAANPGLLPSNRCCVRNGLDQRNQRPKSMLSNSTGFRGGVHAKSVLGHQDLDGWARPLPLQLIEGKPRSGCSLLPEGVPRTALLLVKRQTVVTHVHTR